MKNRCAGLASLAVVVCLTGANADVIWNEAVAGDLSGNPMAPTGVAVNVGTNTLIGSVGAADLTDWVSVTVPDGCLLVSIINSGYSSPDQAAFMGFNSGAAFMGSPFSPDAYLGFAHFGTNVVNGTLPAMSTVGMDVLSLMANPEAAPGAIGFDAPLGPGTYTFLFQQLGASTAYQFDFVITPAPGAAAVLAMGALLRRRR